MKTPEQRLKAARSAALKAFFALLSDDPDTDGFFGHFERCGQEVINWRQAKVDCGYNVVRKCAA